MHTEQRRWRLSSGWKKKNYQLRVSTGEVHTRFLFPVLSSTIHHQMIIYTLYVWIACSAYSATFDIFSTCPCETVLLFTSPGYIGRFTTANTCSLLYLQAAYDQFIALQKRSNHIVNCQTGPAQCPKPTYGRLSWFGCVELPPDPYPSSSPSPSVFCPRFFNNPILLMTSNILDPTQDSVRNTTTSEM